MHQHFNDVDQYLRQQFDIQLRAEIIREMVQLPKPAHILDCGCGNGSISLQFQSPHTSITLIDISENMIDKARSLVKVEHSHRVALFCTDAVDFDAAEKYDLVLGIGLLAHVDCVSTTI